MSDQMKSLVLYCPTVAEGFGPDFQAQLRQALVKMAEGLASDSSDPWAIKVPFGALGAHIPLSAELMNSARAGIQDAGLETGPFFETLSITTGGLDTPEGLRLRAEKLGLQEFLVGDDPAGPAGLSLSLKEEFSMPSVGLSAVAAKAEGLLLLNAVHPHPFAGLGGAMIGLGQGVLDRTTKLSLHRNVKPTVDTPLCAGCGSCLASCIYDAIGIRSGRAMIDHKICTGCGECMSACHLAGIGPENGMSIPRYQKMTAEAASAVATDSRAGRAGRILHVNFLTPLPRQAGGASGRDRFLKGHFGALLSADPLALDQATWDLLVQGAVHGLRQWSGFMQEPTPLMERAATLGMGRRAYDLVNLI